MDNASSIEVAGRANLAGGLRRPLSPEPRALARTVRAAVRRRVLQPADFAFAIHRVSTQGTCLASASYAGQEGPWAARASTPTWSASSRGGSIPPSRGLPNHVRRPTRPGARRARRPVICRRGGPARHRRAAACRHRVARASPARSGRGGLRHPRARGNAPGNAPVHVASPAVRQKTAPADYHRARWRAGRRSPFVPHHATYEAGLGPSDGQAARSAGSWCILGSNIGNFDPPGTGACCAASREALARGDGLLLGTDLVKPDPSCCWPMTTRSA